MRLGVECVYSQGKKKMHINPIDPLSFHFFLPSSTLAFLHPYPNPYPNHITIQCHRNVPTPFLHFTLTNSSYTSPLLPSPSALDNSSQPRADQRITNHWSSAPASAPAADPAAPTTSSSYPPSPYPNLKRKVLQDGQTHPWYWV